MIIELSAAHKAAIEVAPFACPDEIVTKIVDAAAPLIEAAVREQIARDIRADALDEKKGIPFDHEQDVATVVAWIEEWFLGAVQATLADYQTGWSA
jgi:hypothetical protein